MKHLVEQLRSQPGKLYAVLDGARDPQVHRLVEATQSEHECLFEGSDAIKYAHYAPHLIALDDDALLGEVVTKGWGQSWGIFLTSGARFRYVCEQLRKLLVAQVEGHDGELIFRFYDPRVARVFLPQANPRQQATLFDEVDRYLMEDVEPERLLCFSRADGRIDQTRITLGA